MEVGLQLTFQLLLDLQQAGGRRQSVETANLLLNLFGPETAPRFQGQEPVTWSHRREGKRTWEAWLLSGRPQRFNEMLLSELSLSRL